MLSQLIARLSLQAKEVHTTNAIFKLITRITVNILLVFVVSLGAQSIFGEAIRCTLDISKLQPLLSLKCWAEGVFIDRELLNGTIGKNIISYGVGEIKHNSTTVIHQSYYQWIGPLLIFQAFILYLPRAFWITLEKGIMMRMLKDLNAPIMLTDWKDKRIQLVQYMRNVKKKHHRCYALKYLLCELLSILSIVFNMLLMQWVMNDFWSEFQPAMSALIHANFTEFRKQSTVLFPFQAKCNYTTFGGSGSIVNHDTLCYMPQNIVNEKIFAFLYIWFIVILILSIFSLFYFLMMLILNSLRILDIGRMFERTVTRRECKKISANGDFGYWFTLRMFHKNLSPVLFQDLAKEILESIEKCPKKSKHSDDDTDDDDVEKY